MQDDLEDMMDDINDISETLGRSYGLPDGIDDEELEAELAGIEDELESEDIGLESSTPVFLQPSALPIQPSGDIDKGYKENGLQTQPQQVGNSMLI